MADEKPMVVLNGDTPVMRKTQHAGSMRCPMDIAKAENMWNERTRLWPPPIRNSPATPSRLQG